ncbi:MAG: flagellar basal body-associated FliL family protein [Marinobacter sp.]|nr:flagellar basal body-associated FliL family protein [Marinobacter sp.]
MAENEEAAPAPKKSKLKRIIVIAVLAIIAIGLAVAGTLWFLDGGENPDAATAEQAAEPAFQPSQYFVIDKPLLATLQSEGRQRYVQVFIALEADSEAPLAAAKTHLPLIRSRLLGVLSGQSFEKLQTVEGRDALIDNMLATVNKTLEGEGAPPVMHVLFRNFVLQ